jgi:hypothetical protein
MMWEDDHDYDSAYIEYQKAFKQAPQVQQIREAVLRTSRLAQREDDFEKWQKDFNMKMRPEWGDKSWGELILIYQQGWGPRKGPRPGSPRFPKLYPVPAMTQFARMDVEGYPSVTSQPIYSVQDVAIKTLDDEYATLVAKRVAGVVAKAVIADQVAQQTKSPALGFLANLALNATDRADVRQWSTLPATFQVARVFLPRGKYKVHVPGLGYGNQPTIDSRGTEEIEVKSNRKTFFVWRSFH